MSGPYGSSQILVVLGQHPSGSLITANIFFCRNHYIPQYRSRGARHRCLPQLWWWLLPEIPTSPPRGLPSMSSPTSVVAAAKDTDSTPRGPTIDVLFNFGGSYCWTSASILRGATIDILFNFGGGCCQTSASTTYGAHHRRLLQLRWWLLPDFGTHPQGAATDVFFNFGGGCDRTSASTPQGGPPSTLEF
jgi:hypothetical protein